MARDADVRTATLRRVLGVALSTVALVVVAVQPADAWPPARHVAAGPFAAGPYLRSTARPAAALRATALGSAKRANWTAGANLTQGVEESGGAVFLKGKVYLPGGYINVSTPTLYGHMQTYDIASDKWTAETERIPAAPPGGGWGDAAVCTDGTKVYVVNGGNGRLIYSALQIYDPGAPAGQRWTISPHAPSLDGTHFFISQQSGCAWIGGKMYLFGGLGAVQPAGTSTIQKLTWAYNPATHTWTDTGKKLRVGTWFFGYTSSSSTAFFAGGTTKIATGVPNKEAESFSPAGGWKSLPSLPVPASSTVPGLLVPSLGMLGKNLEVFAGGG